MSARSFRRRLDRLERAIKAKEQNKDHIFKFMIDPLFASALRDDYERSLQLRWKESKCAAEIEEKAMLDKRIADAANSTRLPPEYGAKEAALDERRLRDFEKIRRSPRSHLNSAQNAEEAELRARVLAFDQTDEGRGRKRLEVLLRKLVLDEILGRSNTAEQNECAHLSELYPPLRLPPDPEDEKLAQVLSAIRKNLPPMPDGFSHSR